MKGFIVVFLMGLGISAYSQKQPQDSVRATVFTVVEIMPTFPGGKSAFDRQLKKNFVYTKEMEDMEGTIFVKFIVHEDGSTSDFTTVRGVCEECDANAIAALKKLPRWNPGTQHGKPVKTWWVQPVKMVNK